MFSEITVTIEGNDYNVPAEGDPLNLMLKDGTEVVISPSQVQIGSGSVTVPTEPPSVPTPTLIGNNLVTFKERALNVPSLSPPESAAGQAYAKQMAQNYINVCNETSGPAAEFLVAMIDFFARYDAPNSTAAEAVLGTEAAALVNVSSTAQKALKFFDEPRISDWDGFLLAASRYNMTDAGGAGTIGRRQAIQSPKAYVDVALAGLPGVDNLCQRAAWRMEHLLNLARFLSDAQANQATLVPFLQKYRSQLMNTMPDGNSGLRSGGGAIIYGSAAFDMISRVQLDTKTYMFGGRSWDIVIDDLPIWYFRSLTNLLDQQVGTEVGIDEWNIDVLDYQYLFDMDLVPGASIQQALTDFSGRVNWCTRELTEQEYLDQEAQGLDTWDWNDSFGDDYDWAAEEEYLNSTSFSSLITKREMQQIPLPPAWPHQRLLGARSTDQQPLLTQNYARDSALGYGITVFVIDSGFGIEGACAAELRVDPANLAQNTYMVPNSITLKGIDQSKWVPEMMNDPVVGSGQKLNPATMANNQGHGTGVASIAIGASYGIAQRADPYLIKISGTFRSDKKKNEYTARTPTNKAVRDAFRRVLTMVKRRSLQGKAVVNLSASTSRAADPKFEEMIKSYLPRFANNGISFVIAAGNQGQKPPNAQGVTPKVQFLGERLPASYGLTTNPLITVGSVHSSGRYYRGTTPEGPDADPDGPTGSLTVVSTPLSFLIFFFLFSFFVLRLLNFRSSPFLFRFSIYIFFF